LSLSPLVLASSSPRRKELLQAAGVEFLTDPALGLEIHDPSLDLATLVMTNARAKALEVAARHPHAIVVGADTLVWLEGRALGKPRDQADAQQMLRALSGRVHEVATGVHLAQMDPRQQVEFHEVTRVRFRTYDDRVIEEYMETVNVMDKAGAYALQERGELLVESVEGSRSNVVGLPVERTLTALNHHFGRLP
jgi:septum formation protein